MNRGSSLSAIAFVLLVALVSSPPLAGATPQRVVMMGDSITLGTVSSGLPDVDPAYPGQVDALLGPDVDVTVAACGGTISRGWQPSAGVAPQCYKPAEWWKNLYTRFVAEKLPFDIATVLLGTNDAIAGLPFTAAEFAGHLNAIIGGLFSDGINDIVLMVPPILPTTFPTASRDAIWDYRDEILTLCDSAGDNVHCGPDLTQILDIDLHFDDLDPNSGFSGRDIHPNAAGHVVIANALAPILLAIPEPGSLSLTAFGLACLGLRSRQRSRIGKRF